MNHYGPGVGTGYAAMNGFASSGQVKLNPLAYGYSLSGFSEFDARNFQDFLFKKNLFLEELQDPISTGLNIQKTPITYSTQSLDRRRFMQPQSRSMIDSGTNMREEVTLRPLNTRPFDYLQRPGSIANLNNNDDGKVNLNLHPPAPSNKLSRSSQSFSEKTTALPTGYEADKNSSMHSIRDIALWFLQVNDD